MRSADVRQPPVRSLLLHRRHCRLLSRRIPEAPGALETAARVLLRTRGGWCRGGARPDPAAHRNPVRARSRGSTGQPAPALHRCRHGRPGCRGPEEGSLIPTLAELRDDALAIVRAALSAADAGACVARGLPAIEQAIGNARRWNLIAAGKAAVPMAASCLAGVSRPPTLAMTVSPGPSPAVPAGVEAFAGGHPVPTPGSLAAGRRALQIAGATTRDDVLVVLLSGGASALLEYPAGGVTLADLQVTTSRLLRAGADISALNAVRKHLSAVKGGRLASAAARSHRGAGRVGRGRRQSRRHRVGAHGGGPHDLRRRAGRARALRRDRQLSPHDCRSASGGTRRRQAGHAEGRVRWPRQSGDPHRRRPAGRARGSATRGPVARLPRLGRAGGRDGRSAPRRARRARSGPGTRRRVPAARSACSRAARPPSP